MAKKVITKNTVEPITLAEAKVYCRVDHDYDNDLLTKLISTARETVEDATNKELTQTTVDVILDGFPIINPVVQYSIASPLQVPLQSYSIVPLPLPLASVSSVTYRDSSEVTQTMDASDYIVDTAGGRIEFTNSPDTSPNINSVTITCIVGAACSYKLKQLVRYLVLDMYENRAANCETLLKENPTYSRIIWLERDVTIA
jgi:uncharacterized phiE125 gp8 family phage protein